MDSKHTMFRLFQTVDFWQCIAPHMEEKLVEHPCQLSDKFVLTTLRNARCSWWSVDYKHRRCVQGDSTMYIINLIRYASIDVLYRYLGKTVSVSLFETIFSNALKFYRLDIADRVFPAIVELLLSGHSSFTLEKLFSMCFSRGCGTILKLMSKHLMPLIARDILNQDIGVKIKSIKKKIKTDWSLKKKKVSPQVSSHRKHLLKTLSCHTKDIETKQFITRSRLSLIFTSTITHYFNDIKKFKNKTVCECNDPDCTSDPVFKDAGKVRGIGSQVKFIRWILKYLHLTNLNVHNLVDVVFNGLGQQFMSLPIVFLLCDSNYFTYEELIGSQTRISYTYDLTFKMVEYYSFHTGVPERVRGKFHMFFLDNSKASFACLIENAMQKKEFRLLYHIYVHPHSKIVRFVRADKSLVCLSYPTMTRTPITYDIFN